METFFFFPKERTKMLPKPPSGFCLNLAGFKKDAYKFKLSLSFKNYFRDDIPASSPHDFVFFSLALSFSHTVSRVTVCLSLNPLYISNHHSTWYLHNLLFVLA